MNYKNSYLLIATIIVFILSSCESGIKYSIDNPTNQPIFVSIDGGSEIEIAPLELKKIDGTLKEGAHKMKLKGGNEIEFTLKDSPVMLNPTQATYITVEEEYSTSGLGNQTLKDTTITIEGKEYTGSFPRVWDKNAVIATGEINYGVDTFFEDEITTNQKSGAVIQSKLFRLDDFKKFYESEYE